MSVGTTGDAGEVAGSEECCAKACKGIAAHTHPISTVARPFARIRVPRRRDSRHWSIENPRAPLAWLPDARFAGRSTHDGPATLADSVASRAKAAKIARPYVLYRVSHVFSGVDHLTIPRFPSHDPGSLCRFGVLGHEASAGSTTQERSWDHASHFPDQRHPQADCRPLPSLLPRPLLSSPLLSSEDPPGTRRGTRPIRSTPVVPRTPGAVRRGVR